MAISPEERLAFILSFVLYECVVYKKGFLDIIGATLCFISFLDINIIYFYLPTISSIIYIYTYIYIEPDNSICLLFN